MDEVRNLYKEHLKKIKEIYEKNDLDDVVKKKNQMSETLQDRRRLASELEQTIYQTLNHLINSKKSYINSEWTVRDNSIYFHGTSNQISLSEFIDKRENRKKLLDKIEENEDRENLEKIFKSLEDKRDSVVLNFGTRYFFSKLEEDTEMYYTGKEGDIYLVHELEDKEDEYSEGFFYCTRGRSEEDSIKNVEDYFNFFSIREPEKVNKEKQLGVYVTYSDCMKDILCQVEDSLNSDIKEIRDILDELDDKYQSAIVANHI